MERMDFQVDFQVADFLHKFYVIKIVSLDKLFLLLF